MLDLKLEFWTPTERNIGPDNDVARHLPQATIKGPVSVRFHQIKSTFKNRRNDSLKYTKKKTET